ncbi:SidA/IucD/PvdA family monooxygenase [Rubrobacter marinus]|uniref:SidA/IucD/PvdA family monooxygenase n=2 Tax=Rubrobacter marinus TaxID=2653852 RepID=A0A6G8Q2B8_9ACTN|nr:SidA/IucD/PvdA family monooxygenase [Rubrobacter marinus]
MGEFDVIIIGAGFAGMYMLHRLRDGLGLSARVLEAASGVGGTWHWNRYPGARCDSESYYYSYSFSEELQQEWEWTEKYAAQPEILRYLNYAADKFDLRRDIQLGTRVTSAIFDEDGNRWEIRTDGGERFFAQFLITAVGGLSAANVPDIKGLDTFEGEWCHTGEWPQEGVDFAGKRVGVVGTGSTGIQIIPKIAEEAGHLTVFQRTPNYSVPARNAPMDPAFQEQVKANYDEIRQKQRKTPAGHPWDVGKKSALEVSQDERQAMYEAAWERGSLRFRSTFSDLIINKEANDTASEFIRSKIREIVEDPTVAETLTPYDHPYATKRPPIDTDYFETYNRDNVSLVDVKSSPIQEITPKGIRTTDAEYELDVLVFATGYDALTGAYLRMDIRGKGGRSLKEKWEAGPRTYLGLQIAGFPNMFTIVGPGSPSILTNVPTSIEHHVEWVSDCIEYMREGGFERIEANVDAEDAWVERVNEAAGRTLLPMAQSSWFLGGNIPGKPRVFMPYAGGLPTYIQICDEVAAKGYEGFALTAQRSTARDGALKK